MNAKDIMIEYYNSMDEEEWWYVEEEQQQEVNALDESYLWEGD